MQPLIKLQSLFSKEEKHETTKALELRIPQLVTDIDDYFEEIRNLAKAGFDFSNDSNTFNYTQEAIITSAFLMALSTAIFLFLLPGNGWIKEALIVGLTFAGAFKYFSKEKGFFRNRINYVTSQTKTLKTLLQNDTFKVSLIVNIEKDFNTLEEKFQLKPDTLSMVKKKRNDIINELKTLLIEENLNSLKRLLELLRNIKEIEEQTEKLLKLEALNEEVSKQLSHVSVSPEENEVTEKIKALL